MGNTFRTAMLAAALPLFLATTAAAETLEDVIARHVEAKGGRDAWAAVRTMVLEGDYTAFSKVEPFTLTRARDHRYLLDTVQNGRKVVIGYDGETPWWENHWFKEGAERITGPDAAVALGEVHLATALFDYAELGMTAEYLGEAELEGQRGLAIKLTRSGGEEETWYLDPETYLEMARVSPGSDFGQPMPQRTFYDDFREVGGVKIPHYVETQWYTRARVMEVRDVELNVDVDDALFAMPAPVGMADLLHMVGSWEVQVTQRDFPGAPEKTSEREASITSVLDGRIVESRYAVPDGPDVYWTLSYDPFRSTYRLTQYDTSAGYMNVLEGSFDEEGRLSVDNLGTDLPLKMADMTIHGRVRLSGLSPQGFRIEHEASIDGGQSWFVAVEEVYSPSGD